tara:strand:- start:439 stop:654 length:216 start_codon:yes stop_codon:yes gene_type:complete
MRILELFSGTHSVGKVAKELGYEVLSLDMDGNADINIDILNWDYKQYPVDILMLYGHLLRAIHLVTCGVVG